MNAEVSVEGPRVLVNGEPATLLGFRVASAALRDDWTEELLAQLPLWSDCGVNAIALWLQGSSGGRVGFFDPESASVSRAPEPVIVRANHGGAEVGAAYGTTSGTDVMARTLRIVEAAARHGIVAIVGVAYRYSIRPADSPALMAARIEAVCRKVAGCRNVILNVWNEPRAGVALESPESLALYLEAARGAAPGRPVGTGYGRAADNPLLARRAALGLLLHDAGSALDGAVEAYRSLGELGLPVVNVESFGGQGNGYLDLSPEKARVAPERYRLNCAGWTRVHGAWAEDDTSDGHGRLCVGRRAYRELVRLVGSDRKQRSHLLLHSGGWFQGASRVERPEQIGPWTERGRWTNTFHPGAESPSPLPDGTVERPGIRWLLEELRAVRRSHA